MNNKSILYLSNDGIFDHIGESQILPYLKKNSSFYKFHLLTFEKKNNLKKLKHKLNELNNFNIKWQPLTYHFGLIGQIYDFLRLFFFVMVFSIFQKNLLIHCRGYIPAFICFLISHIFKIRYLFDLRDFWADEGIEIKKFKLIYKFFKFLEGKIINRSEHTVCLTDSAKKYVINKYIKKYDRISSNNITVIPCGTDFNLFNPSLVKSMQINLIKNRLKIKKKKILLYYGSVGKNYILSRYFYFFRTINIHNNWIFLFIVNNDLTQLEHKLLSYGFTRNQFKILNIKRKNLPKYIKLADLSIFFYRKGMRSLGCSPTKLADLFSMNVPIITDANLGDMSKIVNFNKNSSLLINNFNQHQIRQKVSKIMQKDKKFNIRKNSSYFNYNYGADKYLKIYSKIINN